MDERTNGRTKQLFGPVQIAEPVKLQYFRSKVSLGTVGGGGGGGGGWWDLEECHFEIV